MRHIVNNQTIKISEHAQLRMKQSEVKMGHLLNQLSLIPKINGKLRWRTNKGVFMFEQVAEHTVIVKTFIPKFKYKKSDYSYRKGVATY